MNRKEAERLSEKWLRQWIPDIACNPTDTDLMAIKSLTDSYLRTYKKGVKDGIVLGAAAVNPITNLKQVRREAVEDFIKRVNARAEVEMMKTHKLEGAHHRAMKAEMDAIRVLEGGK